MLGWPRGHPHHEAAKQILDEENINEVHLGRNLPIGMDDYARSSSLLLLVRHVIELLLEPTLST